MVFIIIYEEGTEKEALSLSFKIHCLPFLTVSGRTKHVSYRCMCMKPDLEIGFVDKDDF